MRQVAEILLKALATKPEGVVVDAVEQADRTVLTAQVAPEDLGRVIGRQGRTIQAVRTVVKTAGFRMNRQVHFDLLTPEDQEA